MSTAVLTLQSKGQIMIPKAWRDDFGTNVFQAVNDGSSIILQPIRIASDAEFMKSVSKVMKKNAKLLKSLANK